MKKLLSILGVVSLVGSTSATVVSCQEQVTTKPPKIKTKWSDEDILQRLGNLEFEEMDNGDIKMISKENHFKIWSGTENGNKYERVISKDNVENSKINYFYNSLLPTDVSYEKPFGIELMSGFYIGKTK
ncbi:lipoprotein [Spiroplasma endosymbiont of Atherix ibis]|uniref:lipoprotein n=1 Tax=Spiroplasma endosymbiont of Atherix ibis TaxID=3066291 RepID=UPI0030D109EB